MSNILDRIVYQTNPLIESRKHMNLTEQRLFLIALQGLIPKLSEDAGIYDLEFHEMLVPASELQDLLNSNGGSVDNLKKSLTNAFKSAHIEVRYGKGGIFLRHIFSKLDYVPQKGLRVQLDPELKPFILDLVNKPYTSYALKYVFPLSSEYALRIVELMLQYKGLTKKNEDKDDGSRVATRYFSVDDLRFKLDVPPTKYVGRMDNFRQFILDNPIAEINRKTMFHITYEVNKDGRNVIGFTLHMVIPAEAFSKAKTTIDAPSATESLPAPDNKETKPSAIESSGMSEADFVANLTHDMLREGIVRHRIKTWISQYGAEYANELFRFAVRRADKTDKVGTGRTRYIASCMNSDWLKKNKEDEQAKKSEETQKNTSRLDRLESELKASGFNFDPAKPVAPVNGTVFINILKRDIARGDLSSTTYTVLKKCNMTIHEFYKRYMQ